MKSQKLTSGRNALSESIYEILGDVKVFWDVHYPNTPTTNKLKKQTLTHTIKH